MLCGQAGITCQFEVLPDSERTKSFKYFKRLCEKVCSIDFKKKTFLVAFGGGVIGDLVGFTASAVKRGMPFVNIATSFLAQIDSSVGGKTAIDLPQGKNLVGAFWQPSLVLIDTALWDTLPEAQIREGLAEAIKYGLISSPSLFESLEKNASHLFKRDKKYIENIIAQCVMIKRDIVLQDEREEKGIRTVLNLGHTVAHGLEAVSRFKLSHGQAVSIGLIAAIHLSRDLNILSDATLITRLEALLSSCGMPRTYRCNKISAIMSAIAKDKKFVNGLTRFVLIDKLGVVTVKEDVPQDDIRKVVTRVTR
jgi:3-dehydroquinate synthase